MNKDFIREIGPAKWALKTIQRQFFKRVLRRDHYMLLPSGEKFLLPIFSKFASEAFITDGDVDWGSEDLLFRLLKKKGFFLDVGANIGYYSVYMLPRVKGVYSFEPDPRMYKMLKQNVTNRNNIHIIQKALGKTKGKTSFTLENDGEISHLSKDDDFDKNKIEVDITTIDSFIQESHLEVEAIKTDVEGFDIDVIIGALHTLQLQSPIVLTEAQPTSELFEIIQKLNYKAFAFIKKLGSKKKEFMEIKCIIPEGFRTKMLFLVPEKYKEIIIKEAAK